MLVLSYSDHISWNNIVMCSCGVDSLCVIKEEKVIYKNLTYIISCFTNIFESLNTSYLQKNFLSSRKSLILWILLLLCCTWSRIHWVSIICDWLMSEGNLCHNFLCTTFQVQNKLYHGNSLRIPFYPYYYTVYSSWENTFQSNPTNPNQRRKNLDFVIRQAKSKYWERCGRYQWQEITDFIT